MARRQKLKVYRTPIGFHDAYVAATSQKEALKAWGADVDLFARGVAEAVTDEPLTREPLATPGAVIRKPRGTSDEHLAALPKDKPASRRRASSAPIGNEGPPPRRPRSPPRQRQGKEEHQGPEPARSPPPKPRARARPRPKPSRARLDAAEQAIEAAQADHEKAIADNRQRQRALQDERRRLEERHEARARKLKAVAEKARERYRAALETWRA